MHRVKSLKGWRKPESGSAEALQEQGWRMIKGDMFAKRMAPGRREEASRVLEQAAERGNARAMCNLAVLLASDERERASTGLSGPSKRGKLLPLCRWLS
jgi:TPR repeat protein